MNNAYFEHIMEKRITAIRETLSHKAKEYAQGDRLYNFKRAAAVIGTTPKKALLGMMIKQFVCVLDIIDEQTEPTEYMVNEKIGDTINYLILLEALLNEERNAV